MDERLTEEQMSQLRQTLRGHELEPIVLLALATGMRRDELLRLCWHELDLDQCEVQVGNSKTGNGLRTVRFPVEVADALREHRLRQRQARLEAGRAEPPEDLVFSDHAGGMLRPVDLVGAWHDLLAQASMPALRFHDLRRARWHTLREQNRVVGEEHEEGHV